VTGYVPAVKPTTLGANVNATGAVKPSAVEPNQAKNEYRCILVKIFYTFYIYNQEVLSRVQGRAVCTSATIIILYTMIIYYNII
jgi:hypothetical protein